jgi:hypothetical protein
LRRRHLNLPVKQPGKVARTQETYSHGDLQYGEIVGSEQLYRALDAQALDLA